LWCQHALFASVKEYVNNERHVDNKREALQLFLPHSHIFCQTTQFLVAFGHCIVFFSILVVILLEVKLVLFKVAIRLLKLDVSRDIHFSLLFP